ncbi:DNA polymerase III subunit delta [Neisseriaceae bacterium CLB008]|nr:DNA polymerase III subunit delta [Neisseriaceae bacterium]
MAALSFNQLASHLKGPLAPLYVIHGEEALLSLEALDALRAAAKAQGYLSREQSMVENHFDWSSWLQDNDSVSLFSEQKLLELHIPTGKPGKEGGDALQQLVQRLPQDTVVVILLPKLERVQLQSKWFTALAQAAQVLEAKAIGLEGLPAWLSGRLADQNLSMTTEALALFAERVEGNLLAAKQELDKLALIFPEGTELSWDDVQEAIAHVARFDVFQLAAAWMRGDATRVVKLLDGLAQEGGEPVLLLWALSEDIRLLLRLKAGLAQNQTIQSMSRSLRLWGEKQHLAPKALNRLGTGQLLNALQTCAQIDRQIKGAEAGDAWLGLKNLALTLAK